MSVKKPKVIVFDLDYTLWPFWIDSHVTPPFIKGKNGLIFDADNQVVRIYPNSEEILKKLKNEGYEIGVASRTSAIVAAHQLLSVLGWDEYIKYKEIYPGSKVTHFDCIRHSSGIDFNEMIFFDDEDRNIEDLEQLGVISILVKNGITHKDLEEGFQQFAATSN